MFTTIDYDLVNDHTEALMSAGRKIIELEEALTEHKARLAQGLASRSQYLNGVMENLKK